MKRIEITDELKEVVKYAVDEEIKRRRRKLFQKIMLGILFLPFAIWAASIAIPNRFSDGDTLSASKLNENFDTVYAKVNDHETRMLAVEALALPLGDYAFLEGSYASGVQEGGCTTGTWTTRVVNATISSSGSAISLNASQITLTPGSYHVFASAGGRALGTHRIRLRNISDNSDALVGTSEESNVADTVTIRSFVNGVITITASKTFEVQHRCQTTYAGAYGYPSTFGINEVYTTVQIRRIKY